MEKIRIRDKHPGSATLKFLHLNLSSRRAPCAQSTYLNCQELERAAVDAELGSKESLQRILHLNLSSREPHVHIPVPQLLRA
jgi:hypothetical protein